MDKMEPIKPGHYPDLSNEAYHADPAIGSSGINSFLKCPAQYYADYLDENNPERGKPSKAQLMGTYAHISILEPEKFNQQFVVLNDDTIEKKTDKAWKEFAEAVEQEGKTPLLHKEWLQVKTMAERIKEHTLASAILLNGFFEQSFFMECQESGMMIKSRPDILKEVPQYGLIMADYKTTGISLATGAQSRYSSNCGRHRQGAHHKRPVEHHLGEKVDQVLYITQDTSYPYLIRVFKMPEEQLQRGEDECISALRSMAACKAKNKWPGYPEVITDYEYNDFWRDENATETLMMEAA